jgi:hypothetical protein
VKRALAALLFAVLAARASATGAVALTLSDADKKEALQVGERSVLAETYDAEWRVSNDSGDTVTVLTPFHRLAIAARHAAFKKAPLKPGEPDKLLKQDAGRLVLMVRLLGRSEDFARHYDPKLVAGDRDIKPTFVQNERTAIRQENGGFVARCMYGFPVRELSAASRVALVVAAADGRDVRRFTIDLSTMR